MQSGRRSLRRLIFGRTIGLADMPDARSESSQSTRWVSSHYIYVLKKSTTRMCPLQSVRVERSVDHAISEAPQLKTKLPLPLHQSGIATRTGTTGWASVASITCSVCLAIATRAMALRGPVYVCRTRGVSEGRLWICALTAINVLLASDVVAWVKSIPCTCLGIAPIRPAGWASTALATQIAHQPTAISAPVLRKPASVCRAALPASSVSRAATITSA